MIVSLVAAVSDNNVIGINNTLPWKMPADMRFFKNLTIGHTVIMGRKTFESMGSKPLKDRKNIIISRNKNLLTNGSYTVLGSLAEAFSSSTDEKEVFVIGGSEIFKQALSKADKIYLTRIHGTFNGDSFFMEVPDKEWLEVRREEHASDEKNPFPYSFIELDRKKT